MMPAMPDLTEFTSGQPRRQRCGISRTLGDLEGDRRDKLLAALDRRDIAHSAIGRVLSDWLGESAPSRKVVENHRNGLCQCPRPASD